MNAQESRLVRVIGWLLISLAAVIVVFHRIAGIDLTEGQLLIEYWPWWVTASVCAILGSFFLIRNQ